MNKYFQAFSLNFHNLLVYRLNFFIGRFRGIVVLLLLFYLWTHVTGKTGSFASYSEAEILTYLFGAQILRGFIFGQPLHIIAREINDGTFSRHLVKPLSHVLYFYWRSWAERLLFACSAIVEVIVCVLVFDVSLFLQTDPLVLLLFAVSVLLAHILYYIMSYGIGLLAFWSREASGPRFLFEWLLIFASGRYFPLSIVSDGIFGLLKALPFIYLLYFPLEMYLGRVDLNQMLFVLGMQLLWIVAAACIVRYVWYRGLVRYSGDGI